MRDLVVSPASNCRAAFVDSGTILPMPEFGTDFVLRDVVVDSTHCAAVADLLLDGLRFVYARSAADCCKTLAQLVRNHPDRLAEHQLGRICELQPYIGKRPVPNLTRTVSATSRQVHRDARRDACDSCSDRLGAPSNAPAVRHLLIFELEMHDDIVRVWGCLLRVCDLALPACAATSYYPDDYGYDNWPQLALSKMATTIGASHELMAVIAGYVPSAAALRALLEALPPDFFGDTRVGILRNTWASVLRNPWHGVLRLLQHPQLDPNSLWPTLQFKAVETALDCKGKRNVWMRPELRPLWAAGVDVAIESMDERQVDGLCKALPRLLDVDMMCSLTPATVNIASGVWTSCTLHISPSKSQDDILHMTSILASTLSLRRVTLDLSQITSTRVMECDEHGEVYRSYGAPLPAALEPHVWAALTASHAVDVTFLGGNLLATPNGIASAVQWLASCRIRRLCLVDVNVAAHDVDALVTAMRNCTTLAHLELSYDRTLLPVFLSMPLPRHVRRLRLFVSDAPLSPDSICHKITALPVYCGVAIFMASAIANSALTHLSIDVHGCGDESSAAILSTVLTQLPYLTHLEMLQFRRGPQVKLVLEASAARIAALTSVRFHELAEDMFDMYGASDY